MKDGGSSEARQQARERLSLPFVYLLLQIADDLSKHFLTRVFVDFVMQYQIHTFMILADKIMQFRYGLIQLIDKAPSITTHSITSFLQKENIASCFDH